MPIDPERFATVRAALMQTTNTAGWAYIKQMTVEIRAKAMDAAIEEDNPIIGESKRQRAKALVSGFNDLFAEIAKIISSSDTDDEPDPLTDLDPFGNKELENGG